MYEMLPPRTTVRLRPPLEFTEISGKPGLHSYPQRSWVGKISQGVTPDLAFEMLRRHAMPFQGGKRVSDPDVNPTAGDNPYARERDRTDILGLGPVEHWVLPQHRTIVNTTLQGHLLHPGNVARRIVQDGDDIYVETSGLGGGLFPKWNEKLAPRAWAYVDRNIREAFNPPPSTFDAFMPPHLQPAVGDRGPPRGALGGVSALPPLPPLIGSWWRNRSGLNPHPGTDR